jgi:hypothetical protein
LATYIDANNIGEAWLQAYRALMSAPGHNLVNLAVNIQDPLVEDLGVRSALEQDLARLRTTKPSLTWHSVHTVANTIFPISLYHPHLPDAASRFFEQSLAGSRTRRGRNSGWGTYIGRLVAYELSNGDQINQLERMLRLLREERHWADLYEAPLTYPGETSGVAEPVSTDMHVIGPGDRRRRGGPCLAHLSLTAVDGRLHLTAQYRRHSYVARAYGNFVGLARLLNFLAHESGNELGAIYVIGTHAEIENVPGRYELLEAATAAQGQLASIETSSRPLGASWRDLDLPALNIGGVP